MSQCLRTVRLSWSLVVRALLALFRGYMDTDFLAKYVTVTPGVFRDLDSQRIVGTCWSCCACPHSSAIVNSPFIARFLVPREA